MRPGCRKPSRFEREFDKANTKDAKSELSERPEVRSSRLLDGGAEVGSRVYVLGAGMYGTLTRKTKSGEGWVRVRSRWGNHHHPVTAKTFRYSMDRIVPEASAPSNGGDKRPMSAK